MPSLSAAIIEMVTCPRRNPWISSNLSRVRENSFRQRRMSSNRISPAEVSFSPVGRRSNSGVSSVCSACKICRLIAEAETCSTSAALRKLPVRATSVKYCEKREKGDIGVLIYAVNKLDIYYGLHHS